MNPILVDSSVWIEYFRKQSSPISIELDLLIETGNIYVNELILSEIVPFLRLKKETELIDILYSIEKIPLKINWDEIIEFQISNLKHGVNKVGIPDLLIVQNVIQNKAILFTLDKHFHLMKTHLKVNLYLKDRS